MRNARRFGWDAHIVGLARGCGVVALLAPWGCGERNTEVLSGVTADAAGNGSAPAAGAPAASLAPEHATFWLDARSGVDFREGGAAIWSDQSPAGHDAHQADPTLRPDAGVWLDGISSVPEFATTDTLALPELQFSAAEGVFLFVLLRRFDANDSTPLLLRGGDGRTPLGIQLGAPDSVAANLRGTRREVEGLLQAGSAALLTLRTFAGKAEFRINGVVAASWDDLGPYEALRSDNFVGLGFSGQIAFAALLPLAAPEDELARFEHALVNAWGCCAD